MRRKELARRLARTERLPPGAAQDRVDQMVHDILRRLRSGKAVELRGLGKLVVRPPRTGKS